MPRSNLSLRDIQFHSYPLNRLRTKNISPCKRFAISVLAISNKSFTDGISYLPIEITFSTTLLFLLYYYVKFNTRKNNHIFCFFTNYNILDSHNYIFCIYFCAFHSFVLCFLNMSKVTSRVTFKMNMSKILCYMSFSLHSQIFYLILHIFFLTMLWLRFKINNVYLSVKGGL